MNDKLYQYLKKEFEFNNLKKYHNLFETWVNNLTLNQIEYYKKLWLKQ